MVNLNFALLGPCDLTHRDFIIGNVVLERQTQGSHVRYKIRPSFSFSEAPCIKDRQPNLGLLFQRYAPEHLEATPATETLREEIIGKARRQFGNGIERNSSFKKSVNSFVQGFAKQWHGSLALEWFIMQSAAASLAQDMVRKFSSRWQNTLTSMNSETEIVRAKLSKRAAIGLANASPWENSGWAFHHTYGVPMIPGDSLKGLMRHYLEKELGGKTGEELLKDLGLSQGALGQCLAALFPQGEQPFSAQALANLLFGKPGSDGAEGLLAIYDAWPEMPAEMRDREGWFALDVVTSHHKDYYTSSFEEDRRASDQDQPNPVHFLTLRPGLIFLIALGPTSVAQRKAAECRRKAEGTGNLQKAAGNKPSDFLRALVTVGKALCVKALAEWGVGAKTGTGYGRLIRLRKGTHGGEP